MKKTKCFFPPLLLRSVDLIVEIVFCVPLFPFLSRTVHSGGRNLIAKLNFFESFVVLFVLFFFSFNLSTVKMYSCWLFWLPIQCSGCCNLKGGGQLRGTGLPLVLASPSVKKPSSLTVPRRENKTIRRQIHKYPPSVWINLDV